MKNTCLLILFVCFAHTSVTAQQYSYGVMMGVNFKDIEVKGGALSAGAAYSAFNQRGFPADIGGYFDYSLNESFGIKANLFYGRSYHEYDISNFNYTITQLPMLVDKITLQPMLKYDVNKEYGKGFYLLAGPRATFLINSQFIDEDNGDARDFNKGSNFGLGLGFGFSFAKIFGLEMIGDYGISNLLNNPDLKVTTIGASMNVYVDLEGLLNK